MPARTDQMPPARSDDLFDAYPAPTFVVDSDVRLLRMNRAALVALGHDGPEALVRKHGGEALRCLNAREPGGCGRQPACRHCVVRNSVGQALSTGAVHRERAFLQLVGDAGPRDVCMLVSAAPCGDGAAVLTLENVGQDLVELKRTVEQLAAEKERLRVTLTSIGDGVITTDGRGRVTLLNAVAEELTGWTSAAATGRHVDEVFRIVREDTREPAENPVHRALRDGVVVGLANHTALVARDGFERPIADSAAPIRHPDGRISGVVLVFRDQTREREAEAALRASERRVRAKLDAILSPDGDVSALELGDVLDADALRSMMQDFNELTGIPMAVIDVRGKVLVRVDWQDICTRFHRVHPETCSHCVESDTKLSAGLRPGEIRRYRCANSMWDVATPIVVGGHHAGNVFMGQFFYEDEPIEYEVFRRQAARYGFDEREYLAALDRVPRLSRRTVAAGMQFFLKFAGMLSQSSFGNLKLARAATEREALLASVREARDRLEETDRRKSDFLAVLSHELRNPLAPIRNSLFVLDRVEPSSAQGTRARSVVARQVDHLSRLVDDLLDVTRISHGKIALNRERIDLREAVRGTCDDNRAVLEARGIEMHLDLPFGAVWVHADRTRVSQAVGNLVQNAAKFTPAGGRVVVSVTRAGAHAEIAVCDTGIGLDPRDVERIFEPFAQGEQDLARTQGGLGLGLALVKALAELHGGSVQARSDGVGRGAEFVVTLPLADGVAEDAPPVAGAPRPSPRRVLVIEDNADTGQSIVDLLEIYDHDVRVAPDGRAGLALARELRPDVVLCDLGLPDMDGFAVARAMRADDALRGTRLVALSGYASAEDRDRARQCGFDDHVAKPAEAELLLRVVAGTG